MTRFFLTLFTWLGVLVAACADPSPMQRPDGGGSGSGSDDPEPTLARIELTAPTTMLEVGNVLQLDVLAFDSDDQPMTPPAVAWTASDAAVLAVDDGGRVTALAAGAARVEARSGTIAGSLAFTVRALPAAVDRVEVVTESATLQPGDTAQLEAVAYDADDNVLLGRPVTWTSSNATVAGVSSMGLVTAAIAGTAAITATVEGKFDAATITVQAPVARVEVDAVTTFPLLTGETRQLTAKVYAADDSELDRTVAWTVDRAAIATVDATGLVTALANGTVVVTATAGAVAATTTIQVRTADRLVINYDTATIDVDEQLQLSATLYDTDNRIIPAYVEWSSDQPLHVHVLDGMITGVAEGGAIITAKSHTFEVTAQVFVARWTDRDLATVNGNALPTTLYEYGTLRMDATGGFLAIRGFDDRYEMSVFGPVYVDGEESGFQEHTSTGTITWNAATQMFDLLPDDYYLGGPMTARYVGTDLEVTWQMAPHAPAAKLAFDGS